MAIPHGLGTGVRFIINAGMVMVGGSPQHSLRVAPAGISLSVSPPRASAAGRGSEPLVDAALGAPSRAVRVRALQRYALGLVP